MGGKPDPYIIIKDGSYNEVYSTQSSYYNDQDPPYEWNLNLKLTNPPYFLWVWDYDNMDGDDNCVDDSEDQPGVSTVIYLPPNNTGGFGTYTYSGSNGGMQYKFTFYKPVIYYSDIQQIVIMEKPNPPVLSNTIMNVCVGEAIPIINAIGTSGNVIH